MTTNCAHCGEEFGLNGCSKPPTVDAEAWHAMSDADRIDAEEEAEARGYVWTDGGGWVRIPRRVLVATAKGAE